MNKKLTTNMDYDIVFLGANFDKLGDTMVGLGAKTSDYFASGAKAAALYTQSELNQVKS